jgi:hypothetical protein
VRAIGRTHIRRAGGRVRVRAIGQTHIRRVGGRVRVRVRVRAKGEHTFGGQGAG